MNWYEDDELWEMFYDCMFDADSFLLAQGQVPSLLALVKHPIDSILDLGCGPGRHCLALAKMGFKITGVDTSKYLLSRANENAHKSQLQVNFNYADMLKYQSDNKYDLIINMFNSFGYFNTAKKNQKVIDHSFQNLKNTGTFIIDTVGKETLARNIEPVHLCEYDNGDIRIERPLLIDDMQVFSNEWILIRDNEAFRRSYQHYVYTPVELTTMCYQAGFNNVRVYGSLAGDPYDIESDRLVIVAEKN